MITWEYIKQLPTGALGVVTAFFMYQALAYLIRIKEKWWCKALLAIACWQASITIIFIGDIVNLPLSMSIFLIIMWFTCEGTKLKKFTLGLLFSSTIFAFNGFYDEGVGFAAHHYHLDELYGDLYLVGRLLFAVFLYLAIRLQRTERDFELSASLWRLMLWLSFCPLGILFSVILLRSPFAGRGEPLMRCGFIFSGDLVFYRAFAGAGSFGEAAEDGERNSAGKPESAVLRGNGTAAV